MSSFLSPKEKSPNISIGSQSVFFNSQVMNSQTFDSFDEKSLSLSNEEFLLNDDIGLIRRNNNNNNNIISPHSNLFNSINNTIPYSSTQESISQTPITQSPTSQIQIRNLDQSDFNFSHSTPQNSSKIIFIIENNIDDIDNEIFDIFQENI